jgi:hypothetical protein
VHHRHETLIQEIAEAIDPFDPQRTGNRWVAKAVRQEHAEATIEADRLPVTRFLAKRSNLHERVRSSVAVLEPFAAEPTRVYLDSEPTK